MALWNRSERSLLRRLDAPHRIQEFLDGIPYSLDRFYRAPRRVMRERRALCTDGAVFAAAALRELGYAPLIMEMCAERDDDHLLAVFKERGHFGAVAKSNCSGLRFREPVYRSLRELVMSYFDDYFDLEGRRSMRTYSGVLNLKRFDGLDWTVEDAALDKIVAALEGGRHYAVVDRAMVRNLSRVDERSYRAGLLGSNPKGLYRPVGS